MRLRSIASCVLPLAVLFLAAGCSRPDGSGREPSPAAVPGPTPAGGAVTPDAAAEGKWLFEQKCSVCHQLERTAYRRETREDWMRIVEDMQSKQKGWISDAEAAKIVEYLVSEQGK